MAAVFGGVLLGVPLVLLQAGSAVDARAPGHGTSPSAHLVADRAKSGTPNWQLVRFHARVATTLTTTAPSTTTTTTAPLAPPPTTTTTTQPPPPTTTTTQPPPPPPPTTTTTNAAPTASEQGEATWYSEAPAGYCASPTLSFGTVLTVTNDATGATTTCTVDDREADNPGRVVDLSYDGFSQIAPPSQGVVEVTVSW